MNKNRPITHSERQSQDINKKIFIVRFSLIIVGILVIPFFYYSSGFKNPKNMKFISAEESEQLASILDGIYPEQRVSILHELPYSIPKSNPNVWAGSAILIDASNGCILFKKNADEIIPPASITKLFIMYIVYKDIADGKVTLDDIVPLPKQSWAVNMPQNSSLMFLNHGQIVTLRELMKGLAVASGNDAAIAIAHYISGGNVASFVERMNQECRSLGLTHTKFVEPSGYDKNNLTTARDLAAFCKEYISHFPQAIEEFHSLPIMEYPLTKNLPYWQKENKSIIQKNTNPLLGLLKGCDGIKTGFIPESRYNIALTAKRNGVRFISITMKGIGNNHQQGNAGRIHDGTAIMEWAFRNFTNFNPADYCQQSFPVASLGSNRTNGKFVNLVPAWQNTITIPQTKSATPETIKKNITVSVNVPHLLFGKIEAGKKYGHIQYKFKNVVLDTIPLVADRSYKKANIFVQLLDLIVRCNM